MYVFAVLQGYLILIYDFPFSFCASESIVQMQLVLIIGYQTASNGNKASCFCIFQIAALLSFSIS